MNKKLIIWLILTTMFVVAHHFATEFSLYWSIRWFDSVMHLWGGLLLGLGVHALCTLPSVSWRPTLALTALVLVMVTSTWEVYEWIYGLIDYRKDYLLDTTKDLALGIGGGLLAHYLIARYTMKENNN